MPGAALVLDTCKMFEGMFITFVDGYDTQKMIFSIAKNETGNVIGGVVGNLVVHTMEGVLISNAFKDAPCLALYNDVIYMFYPDGDDLMYATYSGTGWSTSSFTVPNADSSCAASAVAFNGLLYVFYQGGGGDTPGQGLWYSMFNGSSWSTPVQVVVQGTDVVLADTTAPSAVVYNTQLYVFYQGTNNDGQLWYCVFNGSDWIENSEVSGVSISCSPSAVVYDDDIYIFYQGMNSNGQLWYSKFDGSAWSQTQVTSCIGVSSSPKAGLYQNNIVVVHQGPGDSTQVYYICYDGSSWGNDTQLTPIALTYSPGPVVFNGELYNFMQSKSQNGDLYYTGSNGSGWGQMNQISGASMSYAPGPVVFNNQIYVFYQGPGKDGHLYYARSTTEWSWSSPALLSSIDVSASPTGVYFEDQLVCLFQNYTQLFVTIYDASKSAWSPPFPLPPTVIGAASAVAFTPPGAASSQLYVFYQAAAANGQVGELWYFTFDPSTGAYSDLTQVTGVDMMGNPSAVVWNSELYVFYQSSGVCSYSVFNGTSWTAGTTGIELKESPSATVYNNQIYVFYQGATNDQLYYILSSNGSSWSGASQAPMTALYGSPSATVFNGSLYVFHLSSGDTELYHNVLTGSSWAGDTQVPNVGISLSPSAVVADDQLYVFHEGSGNNGQLWYDWIDSAGDWNGDTLLQSSMSTTGPSAFSYNNVIYCFYESNGQLFYSINAGGMPYWTTQFLVPEVTLTGTASAVLYDNLFYIFYQSASGGELWYVTYDSSTSVWSSPAQVPGVSMTESPSAVVFNNEIYVFYQAGGSAAGGVFQSVFNGSSWANSQIQDMGITESPSACVFNNEIYVFHQGPQSDQNLWYNVFNGTSWAGDTAFNRGMSGSPCAVALVDQLYVFYQGMSGWTSQFWYLAFDGSSWSNDTMVSAVTLSGPFTVTALNNYSWWVIYGDDSGRLSYIVCSGQLNWEPQVQVVPSDLNSGSNLMSNYPGAVVYNDKLYVFYQGASTDGDIWYTSSSDGTSWGPHTGVSGSMSASPSPVVYNNKIYLFHQGHDNNGELCCNVMSSDGSWGGDTQLHSNGVTSAMAGNIGPSAVVWNDQIYCFYNCGDSECAYIVINENITLDGTAQNFETVYYVAYMGEEGISGSAFMSSPPAAVVYGGQVYVFAQGPNSNTQLLYYVTSNPSDQEAWSNLMQAGHGLAAAVGGGILSVVSNQVQAVVEPLVSRYLLPSNLANTAIIKKGPNGSPVWGNPTWTL